MTPRPVSKSGPSTFEGSLSYQHAAKIEDFLIKNESRKYMEPSQHPLMPLSSLRSAELWQWEENILAAAWITL